MKRSILAGLALVLLVAIAPAHRLSANDAVENKVIPADKNNTLIETTDGSLSNGGGPALFVGRTAQSAGSIRRGLIEFDVASAIPRGSKIGAVSLSMTVTRSAGDGPADIELHRVLDDWGEGTSESNGGRGAASAVGDATWMNTFYPARRWHNAGGDFLPAPSAIQKVDGGGVYTWSSPEMAEDVQLWLNSPAKNFGWIIIGDETREATVKIIASRHAPDTDSRPKLDVTFEP